jgi:hypothetical protein
MDEMGLPETEKKTKILPRKGEKMRAEPINPGVSGCECSGG